TGPTRTARETGARRAPGAGGAERARSCPVAPADALPARHRALPFRPRTRRSALSARPPRPARSSRTARSTGIADASERVRTAGPAVGGLPGGVAMAVATRRRHVSRIGVQADARIGRIDDPRPDARQDLAAAQ